MTTHELKCINPYFEDIWEGNKRFELRKNDRDFKQGDYLILKEYDKVNQVYLRRRVFCYIGYVLKDYEGLDKDYCILAINAVQFFYDK